MYCKLTFRPRCPVSVLKCQYLLYGLLVLEGVCKTASNLADGFIGRVIAVYYLIFAGGWWQWWRIEYAPHHPDTQQTHTDALPLFLEKIWKPDTYFHNGLDSYLHTITRPNKLFRISENGDITYSMRWSLETFKGQLCGIISPISRQSRVTFLFKLGNNKKDVHCCVNRKYKWDLSRFTTFLNLHLY